MVATRSKCVTSSYTSVRALHPSHLFLRTSPHCTAERNHNIRIPGFASDETRISLSQSSILPAAAPAAAPKKTAPGTHMTLRSQRLAQVQQAKREAKLM